MRTTIAWVAVLAALACTNRVEIEQAPAGTKIAGSERAARGPRPEPAASGSSRELDCPDGASVTRLAIPAVDTVMTWCVRALGDADTVQHGPWRKERNGRLVEEGAYRDGERHGEWSFRWSDGVLQSRGHYEDGHKSGPWAFWGRDGELIRRVDYDAPPPAAEASEPEVEATEPEPEEPKTVTVSLRFENSHDTDLLFALEPWAEEYDLPPGSSAEVQATGPDTGDLVVESSEEAITVWAWDGSEVQLWLDGIEVGP